MEFERIAMPNDMEKSGAGPTQAYTSITSSEQHSGDVDHTAARKAVWDLVDHDAVQRAVWDQSAVDPVLAKKMDLVNAAIEGIGMTNWHWKLFFLNGFGYAVDSVC